MELHGEVIRFLYRGPHPIGSGHFAGTLQNRYGNPDGFPGKGLFIKYCRLDQADQARLRFKSGCRLQFFLRIRRFSQLLLVMTLASST